MNTLANLENTKRICKKNEKTWVIWLKEFGWNESLILNSWKSYSIRPNKRCTKKSSIIRQRALRVAYIPFSSLFPTYSIHSIFSATDRLPFLHRTDSFNKKYKYIQGSTSERPKYFLFSYNTSRGIYKDNL